MIFIRIKKVKVILHIGLNIDFSQERIGHNNLDYF